VAPGGVELVEPIWSCPSSLLSLVALWGVSSDEGRNLDKGKKTTTKWR
jgi:hypothetical protein